MKKILLVDDENIILYVLSSYLKTWNYEVTSEPDGRKVVEMLESRQKFDVMVSDIRMYPVSGLELLKISKRLMPDMPVILITGFGSHEIFKQAESLGAYKCLPKPFEPETLLKTIESALTSQEADRDEDHSDANKPDCLSREVSAINKVKATSATQSEDTGSPEETDKE